MRLKKEVKIAIAIGLISIALVSIFSIILNSNEKAYEECLINNNNNVNFCHRLIES